MGKCPFRAKKPTFYPISQTNWGNAPVLKLNLQKIENGAIKFKKKNNNNNKKHGTRVHGAQLPFKMALQGSLNVAIGMG